MKTKKAWAFFLCLLIFILLGLYWGVFKKENQAKIIPIKIFHGLPLVTVKIHGQELQLILDLGRHHSSINEEIVETCSLTKTDKTIDHMDVYGMRSIDPVFSSSNIYIGNYFVPRLDFVKSKMDHSIFELPTPKALNYGTIGIEPFLDKVVLIDRKKELCIVYSSHQAKKADPRKYEQGEWFELDFKLEKDIGISLCLLINSEKKEKIILDTGSNFSLIRNGLPQIPLDLRNATQKLSIKLDNGTHLGTFPFYSMNLTSPGLNGILGFDFFDHYIVCVDFLNEKIFLKIS